MDRFRNWTASKRMLLGLFTFFLPFSLTLFGIVLASVESVDALRAHPVAVKATVNVKRAVGTVSKSYEIRYSFDALTEKGPDRFSAGGLFGRRDRWVSVSAEEWAGLSAGSSVDAVYEAKNPANNMTASLLASWRFPFDALFASLLPLFAFGIALLLKKD